MCIRDSIKSGNKVDLIFLDIQMPGMSGMEFLNTIENSPQVIIASSSEKYALDAFNYNVIDYLHKPITYARFFKAANKAYKNFSEKQDRFEDGEIFVKKNTSLIKLRYNEIAWIEALENYVVINTHNDKLTIHITMKSIDNHLPSSIFKRIHRSFIVNIRKISYIEDNQVIMKHQFEKKSIPIGKSFKEKFLSEINLMNK